MMFSERYKNAPFLFVIKLKQVVETISCLNKIQDEYRTRDERYEKYMFRSTLR